MGQMERLIVLVFIAPSRPAVCRNLGQASPQVRIMARTMTEYVRKRWNQNVRKKIRDC
ncbi:MAG: hypothetical protein ACLTBV_20330 [Enterocloster bolteae]